MLYFFLINYELIIICLSYIYIACDIFKDFNFFILRDFIILIKGFFFEYKEQNHEKQFKMVSPTMMKTV